MPPRRRRREVIASTSRTQGNSNSPNDVCVEFIRKAVAAILFSSDPCVMGAAEQMTNLPVLIGRSTDGSWDVRRQLGPFQGRLFEVPAGRGGAPKMLGSTATCSTSRTVPLASRGQKKRILRHQNDTGCKAADRGSSDGWSRTVFLTGFSACTKKLAEFSPAGNRSETRDRAWGLTLLMKVRSPNSANIWGVTAPGRRVRVICEWSWRSRGQRGSRVARNWCFCPNLSWGGSPTSGTLSWTRRTPLHTVPPTKGRASANEA